MLVAPINAMSSKFAFTSKAKKLNAGISKAYTLGQTPMASDNPAIFDKRLLYQRFNITEPAVQRQTYDSFTGLRDKNYLIYTLETAIHDSQRDDKPLSVAMFDMDDFKSVNELLGYETGDVFIREVSRAVSEIAEQNDVEAYRFGGEEFVLVFDGQTQQEKENIAATIIDRVNKDETINSYKNLYMQNAQLRLRRATSLTSRVHRISQLETKKGTLEEVLENLTSEQAKNDPYFNNAMHDIDTQINRTYLELIKDCLSKERDEECISMLQGAQSKLLTGEKLLNSEQEALDEYLYSVFDKANEIYQTRKWISDFEQSDGFGVTCGVVNFEPEALEYKTPMEIIDKAGKVLKKGKNRRKGQIYNENIRL